jgi:hypothetical protein
MACRPPHSAPGVLLAAKLRLNRGAQRGRDARCTMPERPRQRLASNDADQSSDSKTCRSHPTSTGRRRRRSPWLRRAARRVRLLEDLDNEFLNTCRQFGHSSRCALDPDEHPGAASSQRQSDLPGGGATAAGEDLRMHRDDAQRQTPRDQNPVHRHGAEREGLRHLRREVGASRPRPCSRLAPSATNQDFLAVGSDRQARPFAGRA